MKTEKHHSQNYPKSVNSVTAKENPSMESSSDDEYNFSVMSNFEHNPPYVKLK